MHLLAFRVRLLGRFLSTSLHTFFGLGSLALAPFLLGAGVLMYAILFAGVKAVLAPEISYSELQSTGIFVYPKVFWSVGLTLVIFWVLRHSRPALWPSVVHMTPARLDAYADAITLALHQAMITLRDTIAAQPNAPRDAWILTLGLPSTPPHHKQAPFDSLHLHNASQAVIDAYHEHLAAYPWRTALEQVLGKKATHLGLLALHLRGDRALSIHVPAISAHDVLRVAARQRAAPSHLHHPVTFGHIPLLAAI